ncbi:MAG: hypothetical protein AAF383_21300 [Cyanobacteria bacterium P01_A01_bin.83]
MLYLALSCLQGRLMQSAAQELLDLKIQGLQLTPGLFPTNDFKSWLARKKTNYLTHHGFSWYKYNTSVWNKTADCLVASNSIHPPKSNSPPGKIWKQKAEDGDYQDFILETMYPEYHLGNSKDLIWAMDNQFRLAVDVSHIYIQLQSGSLSDAVWRRLQQYEHIKELHLSSNNGRVDIHQPLTKNTFGLDWAKERSRDGIPVVLECYMHRLSDSERLEQIKIAGIE